MTSRQNDDLFEGSTMTFGQHLEELRGALFRSILGLAAGFLIGCMVAHHVVQWIQVPLVSALEQYYRERAVDETKNRYPNGVLPPEVQEMVNAGYMPDSSIMIEPFTFLGLLKRDFPDQFPLTFKPHRFVADDFFTPAALTAALVDRTAELAKQWKAEADMPGNAGQFLWSEISANERRTIEALAAAKTISAQDRTKLAGILNQLVDQPQLHQSPELKKITSFSDKLVQNGVEELRKKLAEKPKEFTADDDARLSRLLIASHFSDYMRPPRVNVVEMRTWKKIVVRTIALNAQEVFMIWMKAALVTGAVIASPWIFYQIWVFVAAGLYPHEKNYVYLYLPISIGLFLAGAALAFFFVFEPVLNFLFSFNKWMNIDPDPRIGEWLGFVLLLPLGFGVSFQLPLVMLFINRIGLVSTQMFIEKWRIAVLAIFVISMVLTPADPISMLLMAVPLTVLYFGGIGMCMWMPRGRKLFDEGYEPS
jgi:sec-independent protein translocase protein TatC